MASSDIRAKIAKGLKKAVAKTGSSASEPVYLVQKTVTPGNPLSPGTVTSNDVLLKDAIFKSYDKNLNDSNIKTGDRQLVSQYDVPIKTGDVVKQGATTYLVISVDERAPTSDTLIYFAQCRVSGNA
jgi:hypothetical protein